MGVGAQLLCAQEAAKGCYGDLGAELRVTLTSRAIISSGPVLHSFIPYRSYLQSHPGKWDFTEMRREGQRK